MSHKYVYLFSEGNAKMRELLGGKGANLAEMTGLGLPVPQGFTISTEACTQYYEDGQKINDEIQAQIMEYIEKMETITGKKFGDKENPLLVSVRSGARASMPGMMDTILNLGLNEEVVNVIAEKSNNPRWAWDCYRRFIQMYSDVVMEVGKKYFEQLIDAMKEKRGVTQDVELTADDLKELAVFNGELHLLHSGVVVFKSLAIVLKLLEGFGEFLFHFGNVHRSTNACNNVFALCVGEELTEKALSAGSRVTGERNACAAIVAHIAERHHLNVNGGTPRIRDIVIAAVNVSTGVVP